MRRVREILLQLLLLKDKMEVLEHHPMVQVVEVVEQVEQGKLVNRLIQGQQMLLVGSVEQEQQVQLTHHQLQEQAVVEAVKTAIVLSLLEAEARSISPSCSRLWVTRRYWPSSPWIMVTWQK